MRATVRLTLVTATCMLAGLQTAAAQGLYASLGVAFATEEVAAGSSGVNHPTRCDSLLYSDPAAVPTDAACSDNTVRQIVGGTYDLGSAFTGSASLGYAWERVRVEAEFLSRSHDGETIYFATPSDNPALQDKANEWSPDNPPHHGVSDFSSRQLLFNAIYDFRGGGAWVPYVGVGAGLARVRSTYAASFQRRTLADGYVEAAGGNPDRPEEWQLAAAGSASILDTSVSDEVFGYQLVAGVERALREGVSAFVTVRWSEFDDVSDNDVWTTIRSHRPVQSDGVTPFAARQLFEDVGGFSATLGIRYEF